MVLKHLHGGDVVGVDIVGRYPVMTFHEIKTLDIEILYGLSLIGYLTGLRHAYSRHLFQYIGDRLIGLREKGVNVVVDCVALRVDFLGLDNNLLQLNGALRHDDVVRPGAIGNLDGCR